MTTAIDLSQLSAPDVIEALDFETILEEMITDLQARDPAFNALVESDPAYKILEVAAYRELLIRQRVNDASLANMLAYAMGADLENLAAIQNVERLVIDPGDPEANPPVDPTYESDTALRARVQLAPEGQSTAGPSGAYEYHALSAHGQVLDVSVVSPVPGEVLITVLSTEGDGEPDQDLLDIVEEALNDETVRPLTDQVTVQAATIIEYTIEATLYFYEGPDRATVLAAAEEAAEVYAAAHHRVGHDIILSGLYAALHQPGVQRVELTEPSASITVDTDEASYCTGITLTDGGTDE
jgi:phage-related baseplate assembly protein